MYPMEWTLKKSVFPLGTFYKKSPFFMAKHCEKYIKNVIIEID